MISKHVKNNISLNNDNDIEDGEDKQISIQNYH